ncbi:MAG: MBL fold metallo-hydrolase [Candidatus Thiodiazotropha sp. (ex Lucinoma aequizonata)]|nr:MBL fold metallo-hydrolase [Candidatus Thiodiazotropha sp. (ex Lucinoma aequizonata)]MCU7887181.1 MBL fold metallo-hydrolase [Candidatus Thiodiazotropha sp. (ex Lucinoma aequizonata)]MCU7895721.1 MBL fold metallo-hydrolase [Candidatus Thiodiazotropha sp. (ex Lucinoma aequizonata)]MCU7898196.1 MBL fold metallo-hydrolase [Candidatus Thiodiazotropha sp. (ex Lucinoma aequizonata)]MCU7902124.1 MBL fold metallo-hydrolase [Candidatus Thiodiazotropha sp. (ex Lucinoma aequizonata)]
MSQIQTTDYSHQITCIDTHYQRPNLAVCYLIEPAGEGVFINTGTSHTASHLMDVLAAKGISSSQVKYVIPTHVHLDHAGGTGTLMQQLSNASLLIHPFGTKHMSLVRKNRGLFPALVVPQVCDTGLFQPHDRF